MKHGFSLLLCSCDTAYVRPTAGHDVDRSCPACGELQDITSVRDVPGPARDKVGQAEWRALTANTIASSPEYDARGWRIREVPAGTVCKAKTQQCRCPICWPYENRDGLIGS